MWGGDKIGRVDGVLVIIWRMIQLLACVNHHTLITKSKQTWVVEQHSERFLLPLRRCQMQGHTAIFVPEMRFCSIGQEPITGRSSTRLRVMVAMCE
jgi:hypothetical protein